MWVAQHCSKLFSKTLGQVCNFLTCISAFKDFENNQEFDNYDDLKFGLHDQMFKQTLP